VARRRWLRGLALGSRLHRRSARFRLTALYFCLFFPSGVAISVVTYVLILLVQLPRSVGHLDIRPGHGAFAKALDHKYPKTKVILPGHLVLDPREFFLGSCVVLVAMIGVSVLLGWLVAGRVLRPLRVMTVATRQISEHNLHERLALGGPDDELKDLGDTIDGLLARLEKAFDSQRRFVANASHELRTPLMLSQTLLQVALTDPDITLDSLRAACQEAIVAGKDQAQLIEALVTLARSQRGLDHREPVDLSAVVADVLRVHEAPAAARGLELDAAIDDAEVPGDVRLVFRLVSNLVDNAIRYNVTGGRVEVHLAAGSTAATLIVANTGPPVPADEVSRLLEPFQRAAPDRTASPNGLGLGLSIVAEIAAAHRAGLAVHPRQEGGLTITVSFPADLGGADMRTPADAELAAG
jgi:signal transduction histidine kinase